MNALFKKSLAVLLSEILLLTAIPFAASAAEVDSEATGVDIAAQRIAKGHQLVFFQFPDTVWGPITGVKRNAKKWTTNVFCNYYAIYGNENEVKTRAWEAPSTSTYMDTAGSKTVYFDITDSGQGEMEDGAEYGILFSTKANAGNADLLQPNTDGYQTCDLYFNKSLLGHTYTVDEPAAVRENTANSQKIDYLAHSDNGVGAPLRKVSSRCTYIDGINPGNAPASLEMANALQTYLTNPENEPSFVWQKIEPVLQSFGTTAQDVYDMYVEKFGALHNQGEHYEHVDGVNDLKSDGTLKDAYRYTSVTTTTVENGVEDTKTVKYPDLDLVRERLNLPAEPIEVPTEEPTTEAVEETTEAYEETTANYEETTSPVEDTTSVPANSLIVKATSNLFPQTVNAYNNLSAYENGNGDVFVTVEYKLAAPGQYLINLDVEELSWDPAVLEFKEAYNIMGTGRQAKFTIFPFVYEQGLGAGMVNTFGDNNGGIIVGNYTSVQPAAYATEADEVSPVTVVRAVFKVLDREAGETTVNCLINKICLCDETEPQPYSQYILAEHCVVYNDILSNCYTETIINPAGQIEPPEEPTTIVEEETTAPVEETTAPVEEPTTAPVEETTAPVEDDNIIIVAGSEPEIFGTSWDGTNEDNLMTKQPDGTYTKEYTVTKAYTAVQLKAVVNGADWIGDLTGNNVTFNLTDAGTFTVIYHPAVDEDPAYVEVTGDTVEFITEFTYNTV